jgi:hypothetical protein
MSSPAESDSVERMTLSRLLSAHQKERVTAPLMFNPSLAAYEQYRKDAGADPDVQKAVAFTRERAASSAMSRRLLAVATN